METIKLYNGEVEARLTIKMWGGREIQKYVAFDKGKEVKDLIRVTDATGVINKPMLVAWASRMAIDYLRPLVEQGNVITLDDLEIAKDAHRRKAQIAADKGSAVHAFAESFIKTGNAELPKDEAILNGCKAFLKWIEESKVQFVSSERMVYSRKHKFIGTMDAEAIVDGKLRVIDFKTSTGIYDEMLLQTAGYQIASEEEGSTYQGNRLIARFDKESGEFEVREYGNLKKDAKAFLNAVQLKRRLLQMEKEKKETYG